jgi:hypothetical protein
MLELVEPILIRGSSSALCNVKNHAPIVVSLEAVDANRMFWQSACSYQPDPTQSEEDAFFAARLLKAIEGEIKKSS